MSIYESKNYDNKAIEKKWSAFWRKTGVYAWDSSEPRENNYTIDTPPPTVSGLLHIGHVYSYTQTDFIARFQRMSGKNVFYPIGFDDNGLPTERLVEKQRAVQAINMSRSEFQEMCKEVIVKEEAKFEEVFSSIGMSFDWRYKYQSISENSCKISQMSFLDLVDKGQAYRIEQPMLWDPVDQTALAQAEIDDKEKASAMHEIEFTTVSGESVRIATTRPELMPACVAVLFNPNDERYKHLVGQKVIVPLINEEVPLIADELVLEDKGTGMVMCCTFGDVTDIVWWRKYNLPLKALLNKAGKIQSLNGCCSVLSGMTIKLARAKVLEMLQDLGLLINSVDIKHFVKCAERSGAPLEIITTHQWFIRTIDRRDALLNRSRELMWHPNTMKIKLDTWINSVNWDWCISRQRYFGVPFPVWYSKRKGEDGRILYADKDQLPVDPYVDLPYGYTRDEVIADADVMDTWATSAVSPQLVSSAINVNYAIDYDLHKKIFPMDLRPQAHEILRTWAFYTLLKADLHENTLPWKNIMVSGWCLAEGREKMSKSKGNVIVPELIIEEYGADALRYWVSSGRSGADIVFTDKVVNNGKRIVNKLWNASKFVIQHFDKISDEYKSISLSELLEKKLIFCSADIWILKRLESVLNDVTHALHNYDYSHAREMLEQFFMRDFCDNYLEVTKQRAYNQENSNENAAEMQMSVMLTLYNVLNIVLRMWAPFVPYITEEIYSSVYDGGVSIHHRGNWPVMDSYISYDSSDIILLLDVLELVRKCKSSLNLSIKAPIDTIYISSKHVMLDKTAILDLLFVLNAQNVDFIANVDMVNDADKLVVASADMLTIGIKFA